MYHCQQAAEKSLKGYLAFRDRPLERTHDLERLLEIAMRLDSRFSALEAHAEALNPYASAFRYPQSPGILFPPMDEVTKALEYAQAAYDFVLSLLPAEVHPGKR